MTFLPLYNIFLFHTPHPHKGDGLTAVPFVFCFFNHPPARIPPHCAHNSAVRMHQHTNPDHCCTHSNERGQPGKTACRKTPAAPPPVPPHPHPITQHANHADSTATAPPSPCHPRPSRRQTSPRTAQTPRSSKRPAPVTRTPQSPARPHKPAPATR